MQKLLEYFNIDAMVFGAIVASVALAFVLVVVIFSVRYKGLYERMSHLKEQLKQREESIVRLEETVKEAQILAATQAQEISQAQESLSRYEGEKLKLEEQLALARERIETQRERVADLEKKKAELETKLEHLQERLADANGLKRSASATSFGWSRSQSFGPNTKRSNPACVATRSKIIAQNPHFDIRRGFLLRDVL